MRNIFRTITLLSVTASLCSGHLGDRLVPVFEIPGELLAEIDIHDGEIEDWLTVIGEPSLTGLDLTPQFWEDIGVDIGEEYNPGDFDVRIWLAWHRELNRIYVAAQGVDDVLVNKPSRSETYWDGMIFLEVDGDHSGGISVLPQEGDEDWKTWWQGVQFFRASPLEYRIDPTFHMGFLDRPEECCWFTEPPYADMASAVRGERPSSWVTEMYVTPFDRLVPDSKEETVISELGPEKVIGFRIRVFDVDDLQGDGSPYGIYTIPPMDPDPASPMGPDFFGDGLLVPAGGMEDSAVGSVSWGRIKASLEP